MQPPGSGPGQGSPFRGQLNQGAPPQQYPKFQKSFYQFMPRAPPVPPIYQATEFDGKRLRKAIARKTVDYNSSVVKSLESRAWQRDFRDRRAIQPDVGYYTELVPPLSMKDNPINCVTTKFVRTSTNKMRCPIFCVLWTPEGRRLVTGASSGEFTLWNGLTFNFETILQAHDSAVRVMMWSRNDSWMVTADHGGYVKYWQSNMNNVKMFQAHKEPIRAISFCPTDTKFATCSDDGTVRIYDFLTCREERILRGHGADVKGVDWHPSKSLVVSGSKDSQQPIKLWDPKTGQPLATLHAHKNTVMDVKWNQNGNWLLTASRDHLIKIFDIRNMSQEIQTFRGHKKEACCLAWHPIHENLFASGGSDGSIMFWLVGTEKEVGGMEQAHDSVVWSLSWHPLGHILASGSNDHTCKFWTRNRPGDKMRDKYNLNLLPKGQEEAEYEDIVTAPAIPGMGFSDNGKEYEEEMDQLGSKIPGLGSNDNSIDRLSEESQNMQQFQRKIPFTKPIPKQFQQQWSEKNRSLLPGPSDGTKDEDNGPPNEFPNPGNPMLNQPVGMPPHFQGPNHPDMVPPLVTDYHHGGPHDRFPMFNPLHPPMSMRPHLNHIQDNHFPPHRSQSPSSGPNMLSEIPLPNDGIRHRDTDERFSNPIHHDEDLRRKFFHPEMRGNNEWRPDEEPPPWTRRPPEREGWGQWNRRPPSEEQQHWQRQQEEGNMYHNYGNDNDFRNRKRQWHQNWR